MIERIKDYRQTWNYTVTEPVAGNYYPVNALIFLKDSKRQLTILNERTQGGSSLHDGEIELMIHRRILADDRRGVGEALNETQSMTGSTRVGVGMGSIGSHYLFFTTPSDSASFYRPLQDRIFAQPYLTFATISNSSSSVSDFVKSHVTQFSFSQTVLPPNLELITLQPWNSTTTLLRIYINMLSMKIKTYHKMLLSI